MGIEKIGGRINKVVEVAGVAVLILMIIATSLQVITRYVLNASLTWSDELARYCFIWCSMLGATVACKRGSHATIDVFVSKFKGKAKKIHKVIVYLILIYIAAILSVKGIQVVMLVQLQRSTAMHIPMSIVYAALPVNTIIIAIQFLLNLIVILRYPEKPDTK